jgi:hypothetical protein
VRRFLPALLLLLLAVPCAAVLLYGPTARNLSPPSDARARAWRCTGFWGGLTGTAIGPHHFITARHGGGWWGRTFVLDGTSYRVVAATPIDGCDLTVWQIAGTFPTWALLYDGDETAEPGQRALVLGRGRGRGAAVRDIHGELRGWRWGDEDHRLSWGQSRVRQIVRDTERGELLAFVFSPDDCTLTKGDSGGGIFLLDAGEWKLAGVGYGIEPPGYAQTTTGPMFEASLVDGRGFMVSGTDGTVRVVEGDLPVPSAWLATRIAPHRSSILAIVNGPLTPDWPLLSIAGVALITVLGTLGLVRRRKPRGPKDPA